MAINMSSATVDDSSRNKLLSSEVSSDLGGGVDAYEYSLGDVVSGDAGIADIGDNSGAKTAGITTDFVPRFTDAMANYKSSIQSAIDQIEAVDSGNAFRGEGLKSALVSFINGIKTVATSYINALETAENQIISSVQKAYEQQDTDISGNLNSDAKNVEGSAASV